MNTSLCYSCFLQSILLFLLLASTTTFIITTKSAQIKTNDEVALRAFKSNIVHDSQGILTSWNDSHHFCKWEGITCSHRHRRVTVLDLSSRGLFGSLSPYVGNLSFLRELVLYNNSIQGEIPHELGRLNRLTALALFNNSLVGEIPANLSSCSRLIALALGNNKLVGKIPPQFISLYNLRKFSAHINNLRGGIPPFLGNLTSLEAISFAYNSFGGNIPDSLCRLKMLTFLGLANNNLSGTIPLSLYNLSFLASFSVSQNQLHGSLPQNLGLTLPNLQHFQISDNSFDRSIPVSLSNASKLELIQLTNNHFSGKLLVDFGSMKNLAKLNLGGNNLGSGEVDEMSFIDSLVNCSKLITTVSVWQNQFNGALPYSIANLSTTLQSLFFNENQLYGSIPPGLANLVNLNLLLMNANQFTGPIPKEMGMLHKLQALVLFDNQLLQEIPSSLGNLSLLSQLFLHNNKLSGVIPPSFGNLKQLSILELSQNDLSGTIPEQIFNLTSLSIALNLAQNHLVGSIPPSVGNLKVLMELAMSDNYNLSGEIPNELGLCASIEYLYMDGNLFHGSIPPSLISLKGIRKIDLSRNKLFGQIPKFLETLRLENLNLSFNDLEGEVPVKGIFANASAISVVGNNRLCGGINKLQLPKCPNNDSKKDKISIVFKILISIVSVVSGLTMMSIFIFCWCKKGREQQASGPILKKILLKVSYERLLKATYGFSPTHLIGLGSVGSVYKGILDQDGTVVAVKVLNLQCRGASKSFMSEVKALRNIRHRNLVRVITSCSSIDFQGNDFKAIIYEFMANGSLENWLHPTPNIEEEQLEIQSLTILQRINIAIDVASALDYLHHHCQEPILHCDLKPSNILLDDDMTARVGDFGLAKFLPQVSNPNQSSSLGIRGTIGYTPPEYGLGSAVSTRGDVYSYGILLLEMVTRKKPTDLMFDGSLNLHDFARIALSNRVDEIVDPLLINEEVGRNNSIKECLISMARIGVACSMESPQDRMNITHAVNELQLVRNIFLQPTTTGFNMQTRQ